jgi:hypothetical protein
VVLLAAPAYGGTRPVPGGAYQEGETPGVADVWAAQGNC